MRLRAVLLGLAFAWLCARDAVAADCSLKQVNTVPMTMERGGRRPIVPVFINGMEKPFLLDTGGLTTAISAAAAAELKLTMFETSGKLLDLYGHASTTGAMVETVGIGRLKDRNAKLAVMTSGGDQGLFSGLLAPDYMGEYDIELDFSGGKMNYFSPDHCEGQVVYWPAAAIAAVPIHFTGIDRHLHLDVTLDGHTFRAILDTGAPETTLYAAEAKRVFGVTAETATAADKHGAAFEHIFQKLSFEGMEIANPHVLILPEDVGSKDPNNGFVTGTRTRRVDDPDSSEMTMLIGMNILSKLHLYIAFREQKIYITPASAPQAATSQ